MIEQLIKRVEVLESRQVGGTAREAGTSKDLKKTVENQQSLPVSGKEEKKETVVKSGRDKAIKGMFDVDEDDIQRALERTLVISGALLVPYGQFEIQPGFNYLRYSGQGSALVQQGSSVGLADVRTYSDVMLGSAFLRWGLPWESQLEGYIPYEWMNRQYSYRVGADVNSVINQDANGLSDVRLGLAKTLLKERSWWPDIIARITWDSDSGRYPYQMPLGSGYDEIGGSLTFTKRQDPLVFYGTVSYQAPLASDYRAPGDMLGVSIGTILGASPETSLRFFINQNFISDIKVNGTKVAGTSQNNSTVNIGASTVLGKGFFMDFTSGIGLTDVSPDYTVGASFAYRFDLDFMPAFP